MRTGFRPGKALAMLSVFAAMTAPPAGAKTFYVSADGDDSADGLASAPAKRTGPWQTLHRVSSERFSDGDEILLRCADKFDGPLDVTVSPAGGRPPLRIGIFGTCPPGSGARIDGSHPVDASTSNAANPIDVPIAREVSQVFLRGESVDVARFPKSGYRIVPPGTAPATDRLSIDAIAPGRDLSQATLFARTQSWLIERRTVVRIDGGSLGLDKPLAYPLVPSAGIYLTGKRWMVGPEPGWASDLQAGSLRMVLPSGAAPIGPSDVRVSDVQPLVRVRGMGSVSIDTLTLLQAGQDALEIQIGGSVQVRDLVVRNAARNGIRIVAGKSAIVERCTIQRAGQQGIVFESVPSPVARSNVLRDIATTGLPQPSYGAIETRTSRGAVIEDNVVSGSGYVGIRIADGATVRRNIVEQSCLTMSDCAAIYTWRRGPDDESLPSVIADNTIAGVIGEDSVRPGSRNWAVGIYLDDFTSNVTVERNLVVGARQGLYLHNAAGNTLRDNIVVSSTDVGIIAVMDSERHKPRAKLDNVAERNAVLGTASDQPVQIMQRSTQEPFRRFADNVIGSSNATRPQVSRFVNEGAFSSPRFNRSPVAAQALTGDANSAIDDTVKPLDDRQRARLAVVRNGNIRVIESPRFRLTQGTAPGTARGTAADGCREFTAGTNDGPGGSIASVTLCRK